MWKTTVAARVVGRVLGVHDDRGDAARCSRAACEKLDIGSLAMISAASASPRASVSAVVYSPGLKRGYPRQVHGEGITRTPGDHVIGAGDIAVSAHRLADKPRVGVHVPGQRQERMAVQVLAARHGEAHAEEDHSVLGLLHPVHQALQRRQRHAGFGFDHLGVELNPLGECSQCPQGFEVFAGLDLNEQICGLVLFVFRTSTSTQ